MHLLKDIHLAVCLLVWTASLSAQEVNITAKGAAATGATTGGPVFTTPPDAVVSDSSGAHFMAIADTVTSIEEKELAFDATLRAPRDPSGDQSNGVRFYLFTLKPKEKVSLKLEAENPNHVGMEFLQPSKPDKMQREYARLNMMLKTVKSSRQEIRNITSEPYQVGLMVYGRMHHWFKVHITRTK